MRSTAVNGICTTVPVPDGRRRFNSLSFQRVPALLGDSWILGACRLRTYVMTSMAGTAFRHEEHWTVAAQSKAAERR